MKITQSKKFQAIGILQSGIFYKPWISLDLVQNNNGVKIFWQEYVFSLTIWFDHRILFFY